MTTSGHSTPLLFLQHIRGLTGTVSKCRYCDMIIDYTTKIVGGPIQEINQLNCEIARGTQCRYRGEDHRSAGETIAVVTLGTFYRVTEQNFHALKLSWCFRCPRCFRSHRN